MTDPDPHPAEILMRVVINLLAPMFLAATNGDLNLARRAALETVNQYHPRNHVDLVAIAQIIAFSMTALGSLSLSHAENLELAMVLRLRTNAAALNRAAEQNRRVLREANHGPVHDQNHDHKPPDIPFVPNPNQDQIDDDLLAAMAVTQERAVHVLTGRPTAQPPAAQPNVSIPAIPVPSEDLRTPPRPAGTDVSEAEWQAMWANSMINVAQEFTADLKNMTPAERAIASNRATVLTAAANDLLSGHVPPRPRPGDAQFRL